MTYLRPGRQPTGRCAAGASGLCLRGLTEAQPWRQRPVGSDVYTAPLHASGCVPVVVSHEAVDRWCRAHSRTRCAPMNFWHRLLAEGSARSNTTPVRNSQAEGSDRHRVMREPHNAHRPATDKIDSMDECIACVPAGACWGGRGTACRRPPSRAYAGRQVATPTASSPNLQDTISSEEHCRSVLCPVAVGRSSDT